MLQDGGREALLVASALVGTDYNCDREDAAAKRRGVSDVGNKKVTVLLNAMLEVFRQESNLDARSDAGFANFAAAHFGSNGTPEEERFCKAASSKKVAATMLKNIREHKRNEVPASFADELRHVRGVFDRQGQLARARAQQYKRQDAVWTGRDMRRGELMLFLERMGIVNGDGTVGNAQFLKVMALDVELMMRAGEARQALSLLNISSISKVKDWYKAAVRT